MTARMRHGIVQSSTATTVDVSLDGVVVTAFLLDGVVLTAGQVATLIQDGRRLVAVGGIGETPTYGVLTGTYITGRLSEVPQDGVVLSALELSALRDSLDATYVTVEYLPDFNGRSPIVFYAFGNIAEESTIYGPGDVTVTAKVRMSTGTMDVDLYVGDYESPRASDSDTVGTSWVTLTATVTLSDEEDGVNYGWIRCPDAENPDLDIAQLAVDFTPA